MIEPEKQTPASTPPELNEKHRVASDEGDDDDLPPELLGPTSRRWGTIGLVLVNVAVGLAMALAGVSVMYSSPGDIIAFGAVEPGRVWSGEVWRLLTACFVHVGSWHLGLNLWVLWQVGHALERLVGTPRLVLIYVASGIFGFALSVTLMPGLTAGASGAIFGITGALLAIAALTRQRALGRFLLTSFVPFVVATFALGAILPMINNVAHFGGLLMGFLLTYGLSAGDRSFVDSDPATAAAVAAVSVSARERQLGAAALVLSLVGFAVVTIYAVDPRWSPRFHAIMGLAALHRADLMPSSGSAERKEALAEATLHAQHAAELAPDDAATHLLSARLLASEGKLDEARAQAAVAFTRFENGSNAGAAFEAAVSELGLLEFDGHDDGEMPYSDGFTVALLCSAALPLQFNGASPASTNTAGNAPSSSPAAVKNACAWLLLRAREPAVRDPVRALALAKEAFEESGEKDPAITHTYASALAQNNDAAEGLALLERLVVQGNGEGLDPAFLSAERQRLQHLADEQRRSSAEQPRLAP